MSINNSFDKYWNSKHIIRDEKIRRRCQLQWLTSKEKKKWNQLWKLEKHRFSHLTRSEEPYWAK